MTGPTKGQRLRFLPLGAAGVALALSFSARGDAPDRWWSPGEGRVFPAVLDYANGQGSLRTLLVGGPMPTKGHPFFEPRHLPPAG